MKNLIILPNALATEGLKSGFLYFIKQVHLVGGCGAVQSDLGNNSTSTHSYTDHFLFLVLNKTSFEQPTATQHLPKGLFKKHNFTETSPGPKDSLQDILTPHHGDFLSSATVSVWSSRNSISQLNLLKRSLLVTVSITLSPFTLEYLEVHILRNFPSYSTSLT